MKVFLFVSSKCPHCPKAERIMDMVLPEYREYDILFRKVRMKTEFGKGLSTRYNVMGTPTILFADDNGDEIDRIVGVPSKDTLRKRLEKSLGLKKSFLDRIFG
ncbi:MAG: thioredoxin family protein [Candidatus Aenigmarchaeota archaeon]|nr:thioredoxin family protein [Candidatus Aenigmarchaeota archaeon]